MRARRERLRTLLFMGVGILLTTLGVVAYATDVLGDSERDTIDTRFSIRGTEKPPDNLVLVAIDPQTFRDEGVRFSEFRPLHARVINRIVKDKPTVIAYDVQFSERSGPPDRKGRATLSNDDIRLATAISNAGRRLVIATTEVDENGKAAFLGAPMSVLTHDLGGRFGNGLFPNDPGGVIRRMSYEINGMKTLAVAAVERGTRRPVDRGMFDADGNGWIDYYGPPKTIKSVSFSDVEKGRMPPGYFRDKYVVVGPTAENLQDLHPTSTSGDDTMAGGEIQAHAIGSVLRGMPLGEASNALNVLLIVVLGLVAPVASLRFTPLRALAIAAALGVVFVVAAQVAFNNGTIISVVYPLGTLILVSVGVLAIHYLTTAFERERVRDMFARFVPENVVDEVIAGADGLRLGGVQREGTVMFSDLRGFTSFAESMPPDQVIEILNRYLTEMSDAILNHGGTLVAYMGDGIMAVFGAPVAQDDHADRALAAAREMIGERLDRFNDYLRSEGLGEGFRMGVGLNSGRVMSGNVGSERRLEYTAIGDTTNTAARLEGMTKGTPHMLFLSDPTREFLAEQPEDLVFVGEFEVRGRQAKIKLWSLGSTDIEPEERTAEEAGEPTLPA
jgi:adenylate cyclase